MHINVTNKIFGTHPLFLHAPGTKSYNTLWSKDFKDDRADRAIDTTGIDIITWLSSGISYPDSQSHKIVNIFPDSLRKYQIKVNVLSADMWKTNRHKIKLTLDFIESSNAKYILGGDNSDVVFTGGEFNVEQVLKKYKCRLLFNAEKKFWPEEFVNIEMWQRERASPPFSYLNAGLWVGERKFCIRFFKEALKHRALPIYPYSEQICIHPAYIKFFPLVKVDYECVLFQNLNRVTHEHVDISIC